MRNVIGGLNRLMQMFFCNNIKKTIKGSSLKSDHWWGATEGFTGTGCSSWRRMIMSCDSILLLWSFLSQIFVGGNSHHSNADPTSCFSVKTPNVELGLPKNPSYKSLNRGVQTSDCAVLYITFLKPEMPHTHTHPLAILEVLWGLEIVCWQQGGSRRSVRLSGDCNRGSSRER